MKIIYLDVRLEVTFNRTSPGPDEYEEPEEFKIVSVCMMDGINITALFSEEQIDEIIELIKEELNNVKS